MCAAKCQPPRSKKQAVKYLISKHVFFPENLFLIISLFYIFPVVSFSFFFFFLLFSSSLRLEVVVIKLVVAQLCVVAGSSLIEVRAGAVCRHVFNKTLWPGRPCIDVHFLVLCDAADFGIDPILSKHRARMANNDTFNL